MEQSGKPDPLADALRVVQPSHGDVAEAFARAKVAAALFGVAEPVRIGRYTIESRLGGGGGGVVFVARDPELSRRVAIKLRNGDGTGDRARMLAEGQALARLSHPNIVPVYDAGVIDDQVYVVMELVEGDTLRAFCDAPERRVREVLRAYRQAGEGLAAAHRAGIVHRDFKPDNAVVGRDGRVRVVDFGLARDGVVSVYGAKGDRLDSDASVNVTRSGLGTPRYMAPEQATEVVLTPAADQFAFFASLREGLLACGGAPRWVDALIVRGTAVRPVDRFPSMDAALAALARDPASRWRIRGLAAATAGLAAAAFAIGRSDRAELPSCERGAAELATVWNPRLQSELIVRLTALGAPYARLASAHAASRLDDYATQWRALHRDACVAHRDGAKSDALFDRSVACLSRAKAAMISAVGILHGSEAARLPSAIAALGGLPELERCAAPEALLASVAPPSAAVAPTVAQLAEQLAALEVEALAARPDVRTRIDAAVAAARTTGYKPLIARALRLAGVAAITRRMRGEAVAPLVEATQFALAAGDLPLAVEAFARRAWAQSTIANDQRDRALVGLDLVTAIAAGLPESERGVRALLENNLGSIELAALRTEDAREHFERALTDLRGLRGPLAIELAGVRTNLARVIDNAERRAMLGNEHVAIVSAVYGDGHPQVLNARISVALLEAHRDRASTSLAVPCRQLSELQSELGPDIIECETELGLLALDAGDLIAARKAFERAAMARTGPERVVFQVVGVQLAASVAITEAEREAVRIDCERSLATIGPRHTVPWWVAVSASDVWMVLGTLARQSGRLVDARASFGEAIAVLTPIDVAPQYLRRLARARAAFVAVSPRPLDTAARDHAIGALTWFRTAGGYREQVRELEVALAP